MPKAPADQGMMLSSADGVACPTTERRCRSEGPDSRLEVQRASFQSKREYYEQTLIQELKKNQHLQEYVRQLEGGRHHGQDRADSEEIVTYISEGMTVTSADEEKLQLLNKNTELRRLNKELMKLNQEWDQIYHSTTLGLQQKVRVLQQEMLTLRQQTERLTMKLDHEQVREAHAHPRHPRSGRVPRRSHERTVARALQSPALGPSHQRRVRGAVLPQPHLGVLGDEVWALHRGSRPSQLSPAPAKVS
nr:PREDICTED: uncharacterized protein LOC106489824 [Apteryx mantelli mantelli]